MVENFSYDIENINNIPQWETRNLINLYEKYLNNDYYISNFIFSSDNLSHMHLELYETNPNSKFKMTFDTKSQIKKVKPGKILSNDLKSKWNFIGHSPNIEEAYVILLKPSLKRSYLDNLIKTIETKKKQGELLIDHLAIMHPIFEAIHPFADGNGRIGRLFLSLLFHFIYPKLKFSIYLSEAFANQKETYKNKLQNVQLNNDFDSWNDWIYFFIDALIFSKRKMNYRVKNILNLWNNIKETKAASTTIRKKIIQVFFKYYKVNKKITINKLKEDFPQISLQTIYNDWNIVVKKLKIQNNNNDYYKFEQLRKILRSNI